MLEIVIAFIVIALIMFLIALSFITIEKGENKKAMRVVGVLSLILTGAFVSIATDIDSVERNEGLPVGNSQHYGSSNLPPEDIIQVVKTVDWEDSESQIYLTLVPYNDMNGTRMLYRISWDDCETPISFSVGMKIVNNDRKIEQV